MTARDFLRLVVQMRRNIFSNCASNSCDQMSGYLFLVKREAEFACISFCPCSIVYKLMCIFMYKYFRQMIIMLSMLLAERFLELADSCALNYFEITYQVVVDCRPA